jgi:hypothetical protein
MSGMLSNKQAYDGHWLIGSGALAAPGVLRLTVKENPARDVGQRV